ncbi:SIR2 family protein [Mitsuaria sp. 7]|uniref:SIR2 family protein n=1 Tax=Mitsuaria sp. 7 TaxID=1658665 RepID=UPI0007DD0734|nr:SIR2 family protein [Mitsuaria sp. 7]ANH69926.1 hypothetical protein ABE85_24265 [Mitsuaria sp. 7]
MRFVPNGPDIPDELLTARDAGQVLFFCGAGVSLAQAGLPDFVRLAERVLEILGSGFDSPARRLFKLAKDQPGTVATDRIFGLLEREFDSSDVRQAVAIALQPAGNAKLDAHRLLLDLSRDKAGVPRLVTTNFDALFENCEPGLASFNPPRLPDPHRPQDFHGIIHLHGCVDPTYRGARDEEFVLSSADFGHAYLADGWATRYIQALLKRFRIVFLGYSADDPPVQYLLEALSRFSEPSQSLYAFQSGNASEALAQWAHKGVTPIPYDSTDRHAALWTSLEAWAGRARDANAWHRQLLKTAAELGPAQMAPHERGMVAHLMSTEEGARLIAAPETRLPATWLCVVDPLRRYARPDRRYLDTDIGDNFDPFDAYGLDSDESPAPVDGADHYALRPVPEGAWDGLGIQASEHPSARQSQKGHRPGLTANGGTELPTRLVYLGMWLINVAHQPAALWWAAWHPTLHPMVLDGIERRLAQGEDFSPALRSRWRMTIAAMRSQRADADLRYFQIAAQAKAEGWTTALVREAVNVCRPRLVLEHPVTSIAPEADIEDSLNDLVRFDVSYPHPHQPIEFPADLLAYGVVQFRQALEYSVDLELEVTGGSSPYFDTIRADDGKEIAADAHGLTGHLVMFTKLVSQLFETDPKAATCEVAQWAFRQDQVFIRLRIWAAGHRSLTTPEQAGLTVLAIDDETFWSSRQERDLLFTLRDRWAELPAQMKRQIEERFLIGRIPWLEERSDAAVMAAHQRLDRLHWLSIHGAQFSFDYETASAELRAIAADWSEESARHTARPQVSEVFAVRADTDSTEIAGLPLGEVLAKAEELSGRDFFTRLHRDPFRGLVKQRPSRALSVLTHAKKTSLFPAGAWSTYLSSQADEVTPRRLLVATAGRLASLTVEELTAIPHPASAWIHNKHQQLQRDCPVTFESLWSAMITSLRSPQSASRSSKSQRRWVDEGLNSPAGRLALAQRQQLADNDKAGEGLPASWKHRTEQLLDLPTDRRNQALAMIAADLGWLFQTDREWATQHLLSVLADGDETANQAFWAGFLWTSRVLHADLFPHLKAGLLTLARSPEPPGRDQTRTVAGLLLATWSNSKRRGDDVPQLSDAELREVLIHAKDSFRMQMLWYVERWSKDEDADWSGLLLPFLTKVWPRQLAARTPSTSGRLVDLAFAIPDRFAEISVVILPSLVVSNNSFMSMLDESHTEIAERHPREVLDLLYASLGDDPSGWPYQTGKVLAVLAEHTLTKRDSKLLLLREREQRRRW